MLRLIVPCGWSARMTNSALSGSTVWARVVSDSGTVMRERINISDQRRAPGDTRTDIIKLISLMTVQIRMHLRRHALECDRMSEENYPRARHAHSTKE